MTHLELSIQQLLILSIWISYESLHYPLSYTKRSLLTKFESSTNLWVKTQIHRKQFDIMYIYKTTVVGSSLGLMTSPIMGF